MPNNETNWRKEFEKLGEAVVKGRLEQGYYTADGKAAFGFRWLDDQTKARHSREIWSFRYAKWTFAAALVAVITGVAGIFVTWFH